VGTLRFMAPPRSPGPDGLFASLRRAWFLRSLRGDEDEPPPGAVPRLNLRQRLMIRAILRHPDQNWTLNAIWYTFLLMPVTVAELGGKLSAAGLASVVWVNGKRCLVISELGTAEFPGILALYRSQNPVAVLLRSGPKAAGLLWLAHHRDRVWRRARKRELEQHRGHNPRDESGNEGGPGSGRLW
jgi:hypothetical protein